MVYFCILTVRNHESMKTKTVCYIMKFEMRDDLVLYKIGVTTRNITKRLSEIVMSMFNAYRYIPLTSVRKFTASPGFRFIEADMHKRYNECRYEMHTKVSGRTEFFKIDESDEEAMIEYYCELLEIHKDVELKEYDEVKISKLISMNDVVPINIEM